MASLVPTPSVELARTGLRVLVEVEAEQPGEAAEAAEHLGPVGALDRRLHQLDGTVAGFDVDAGRGGTDVMAGDSASSAA